MKDAYSNLLGEFVQAQELDHDDIVGFQCVCPCCREEIFKVAREMPGKTTHFFSHYKASAAYSITDCERRVANISDSEKTETNLTSRKQTLEKFRAVVRDALAPMHIGGEKFDEQAVRIVQPLHIEIAHVLRDKIREWGPSGKLRNLVQENDKAIAAAGHENLTPFGLSFRNRIAADLLRTVFAAGANKSILYMVARGHTSAFRLKGLHQGNVTLDMRSRSKKLTANRELVEEYGGPNENPYLMTAYATLDGMLRELHRLPYQKMIANTQAKLPPLHNITLDDYLPDLEDLEPNVNYVPKAIEYIRSPLKDW